MTALIATGGVAEAVLVAVSGVVAAAAVDLVFPFFLVVVVFLFPGWTSFVLAMMEVGAMVVLKRLPAAVAKAVVAEVAAGNAATIDAAAAVMGTSMVGLGPAVSEAAAGCCLVTNPLSHFDGDHDEAVASSALSSAAEEAGLSIT